MITLAEIVSRDSSGLKYSINIPILQGRPDSETEVKKFNAKVAQVKKQDADLTDIAARKKVQEGWSNAFLSGLDYPLEFTVEAFVCGIPGMSNLYDVGDWVYVGFINNNMSMPLILGHAVGIDLKDGTGRFVSQVQPSLKVSTLEVASDTVLPNNTRFKFEDGSVITVAQLKTALNTLDWLNNISISPGLTGIAGMGSFLQQLGTQNKEEGEQQ